MGKYCMSQGDRDAVYESCGCVNHGSICSKCNKKVKGNYFSNVI